MSAEPISLSTTDGVAQIIIDRTDKRNAMSTDMWRTLRNLVDQAAGDPAVLVIILRGADSSAFASGADIEEMLHIVGSEEAAWALMNTVRATEHALSECAKPVIAMIRGICIGGGVELALGCDLRFASRNARFAVPPAKLGLVYSVASTRRLIQLVGLGRARDLLYSARTLEAAEALEIGLVERMFDDDQVELETLRYAGVLASRSQYSIRAAKRVSAAAVAGGSDDDNAIRRLRGSAFTGKDLEEGITAFMEKRSPRFTWR